MSCVTSDARAQPEYKQIPIAKLMRELPVSCITALIITQLLMQPRYPHLPSTKRLDFETNTNNLHLFIVTIKMHPIIKEYL